MSGKQLKFFVSLMLLYFVVAGWIWFSDWSDSSYVFDDTVPSGKVPVKRELMTAKKSVVKKESITELKKRQQRERKALAEIKKSGQGSDPLAMLYGLQGDWNRDAAKDPQQNPKAIAAGDKARVEAEQAELEQKKAKTAVLEKRKSQFFKMSAELNAASWRKYANREYHSLEEFRGRLSILKGDALLAVEKEMARYERQLSEGRILVAKKVAEVEAEANRQKELEAVFLSASAKLDEIRKIQVWEFNQFYKLKREYQVLHYGAREKSVTDEEKKRCAAEMAAFTALQGRVQAVQKSLKGLTPVTPGEVDSAGLVEGSKAALELQKKAAEDAGYPLEVENQFGMRFRFIPAGTFQMGSPVGETGRDSDEKQHQVTISRPFYMAVTEVTVSEFSYRRGKGKAVTKTTLKQAHVFCQTLCRMDKMEPGTYQLPTEAQWEFACRSGLKNPFYADDRSKIANYGGSFGGSVDPVAQKLPNPWGLYDMLGNVSELCRDRDESSIWGAKVPSTYTDRVKDPFSDRGDSVVARGGGWESGENAIRAADRELIHPDDRIWSLGFRIIRILP